MFTYALVLLFSLAVPVIRSFEKKHIHFIGKMPQLLPAMLIMALVFIVWDVFFTRWGVWGFNDDYLLGWRILGLPIEEILFFFVIPYVCLFSYEVLNYFIRKDLLGKAAPFITGALLIFCVVLLIKFPGRLHTLWSVFSAVLLLALVGVAWRPVWLGRFYLMFGITLVPFVLVDGVLTGSFFGNMVVYYNEAHIIGPRILTIPFEDLVYGFSMLLMTTALYEWFRNRAGVSPWSEAR